MYHVGYALGRKQMTQGNESPASILDKIWFPFRTRSIVLDTYSLEKAFQLADVLVETMVTDGMLLGV